MPEETELTFSHFVEEESLDARVKELGNEFTAEEVAATAFYLGVLSVTGMSRVIALGGDGHYLMHVMANVFAGDWLSELIKSGSVDPKAMYAHVYKEHGWALRVPSQGMEDIKAGTEPDDGLAPMDSDTFNRLWGGHGA